MNRQRIKTAVMLLVAVLVLVPFAWEPAQSMVYRPRVEENCTAWWKYQGASCETKCPGVDAGKQEVYYPEELERLAEKAAIRLGKVLPE